MSFSSDVCDKSDQIRCECESENNSSDFEYSEELLKKNSELKKENNLLKTQFEQALKIANELKNVHKENNQLLAQIKESKNENEELTHRLELSNKALKDSEREILETKRKLCSQSDINEKNYQKEVERTKNIFKTQLDTLNDQVQTLKSSKEGELVAKKLLQNKINQVLESAKRFFHQTVTDLDSLDIILNKLPNQQTNFEQKKTEKILIPKEDKNAAINDKSKKEVRKMKNQMKIVVNRMEEMQNELENERKTHRELEMKIREKETEISSLKDEISNKESEMQLNNAKYQRNVDKLNQKMEQTLKKQKTETKKQFWNSKFVQVSIAPIKTLEDKEDKEKISKKVAQLTKVNKNITEKLSTSENENKKLMNELVQVKNDLESLKTVHEETVKETDTLRTSLSKISEGNKQKQKKLEQNMKKESRKQETTINQLQDTIKSQKESIQEQENEKTQLKLLTQQQQEKINELETTNSDLEEQAMQLRYDINRIISKNEQDARDNKIPDVAWCYSEFSDSLKSHINSVVCNQFLKPISKLHSVLKLIHESYSKQISSRNDAIREISDEMDEMKEKINDFVVSSSIAITGNSMNYDTFISGVGSRILLDQITELKTSHTDLNQQLNIVHSYIDFVNGKLGISDSTNFDEILNNLSKEFDSLEAKLDNGHRIKKLYSKLKSKHSTMKKEFVNIEETNRNEIYQQKQMIEDLLAEKKDREAKIQTMTKENRQLKATIKSQEEEIQQREENIEDLKENFKNQKEKASKDKENSLNSLSNELNNRINELQQECRQKDEEISKLESTVRSQKGIIEEKEEEIETTKKENKQNFDSFVFNNNLERKSQTECYERSLADIKKQCNKNRDHLTSVTNMLTETQEENESLKLQIAQLKKEKKSIAQELQITKEESERDKRIMKASSQSLIASKESELATKLSEKSQKFEKEKKKLFVFAISELNSLTGTCSSIDEQSFKDAITNAKELISKYSKVDSSIRRIVGASEDQTTDEAVAQAILN